MSPRKSTLEQRGGEQLGRMYLEGVGGGWRGLGECVFLEIPRFMNLILNDVLGLKQMNLEGQNE